LTVSTQPLNLSIWVTNIRRNFREKIGTLMLELWTCCCDYDFVGDQTKNNKMIEELD